MTAYYNEFDPKAAALLRELIQQGHIADGIVDERSISDVRPSDLAGFTQCHFFAGIGVWSYALRRARWADYRPVWTGSCPCQPFSAAGKGAGVADERHLWPHWHHLIRECRPATVFGEQVASKDGLGWLDLVSTDMEAENYAIGAADLCAAGIGAPHIRQRLFFGATRLDHTTGTRRFGSVAGPEGNSRDEARLRVSGDGCADGRLADADGVQRERKSDFRPTGLCGTDVQPTAGWDGLGDSRAVSGRLADAEHERLAGCVSGLGKELSAESSGQAGDNAGRCETDAERTSPSHNHWRDADWLYCRDGKWRPVEPGTFPLAHGAAERVGRLRGYGNAIVAQVAQTFIEAWM